MRVTSGPILKYGRALRSRSDCSENDLVINRVQRFKLMEFKRTQPHWFERILYQVEIMPVSIDAQLTPTEKYKALAYLDWRNNRISSSRVDAAIPIRNRARK